MAYRRKIIDRRTREGKALGRRLDTLRAFGVLALIVGGLVFGNKNSDKTTEDGKQALIATAQATLLDTPGATGRPAPTWKQPYGPADPDARAYGSMAAASTNLLIDPRQMLTVPPETNAWPGRHSAPWRHVTPNGIRWSLRHASSTSMLLLVDLGGDQVATVSVAPAFENLESTDISDRIDHLRSIIGQRFSLQSANYSYDRDGAIRQRP